LKKAVWIAFGASLVLVNLAAWLAEYFTGFYILMILRVGLILGITAITSVFVGAFLLVNTLETERPLTGSTNDTLQNSSELDVNAN